MGKRILPPSGDGEGAGGNIEPIDLKSALEERYLAYALSTIMHRALPDARDGLKPVHRRVLYAMRALRLDPGAAFKKSARVVGDVIGKFHPHGDQSVYDALVRLAQDFAQRYPLVDGQGNFGNVDGDSAAAMRYTEARLTETARLLLDGLDDDTVDFRPTYDGSESEPVVLPAAVPHLLANGSAGIAVGMATSIPPHNMAELLDAAAHLIDNPQATTLDLLKIVKGPDFPTGGIIVYDKAAIREAYETGRGGFRVRARWETEEGARGAWTVIVTEIPYQVAKSRLIEKIAELLEAKKLPLLADVRDESTEDIRIVLEPKSRNVEPSLLMESLFKLTELESRFPLNMNVLVGGQVPKVVGLADLLREWLDHRRVVLTRRSQHRLAEIAHRLEVLGGYLVAYLNIDKVIRIIRNHDDPKAELIRVFKLTDVQATAILDMRLRSLRKLEEIEIKREHDALTQEKASLERLLNSETLQWRAISGEIAKVRESYDPKSKLGRRRTVFGTAPEHDEEAVQEALVEREPITVILSEKGWIRALKGHQEDVSGLTFKTDDRLKLAFYAETTSKIMVFATNGRFYTLDAAKLPGGRGHGEPIRLFLDMEQADDVVDAFIHEGGRKLLVASREAKGFVVAEDDCLATTRKGKQVLVVDAPDEARLVKPVEGDHVATIGDNRRLLVFPLNQVPEMPRGKGVRLQRFRDGGLADAKCFALEDGLSWTDSAERNFTVDKRDLREWIGTRSDSGRLPPKGFPKSNKFE
ncbi:DNA topoisomerase IV subunit A [Blastochloris tepida]|uniref:DNA topoisomerase 4 subunit A n=1 Tax=Blastochloris tepida TaxID=2233851 RepID=A0A348FYU6_9HYPH|nr:DNA topoisomerase IV subunit A [Blastochloris tepida]BBF92479.1 DNA topoisomerase 4 subunit A [Blastochloris tepida]